MQRIDQHLKSVETDTSVIEGYLTKHALVVFCAEIQNLVYKILNARAELVHDEGIKSFIAIAGQKILRSVEKKSLAEIARLFVENSKNQFNASLDDRDFTIYNNAVKDRHEVAHSDGTNISFREMKSAVDAAKTIIAKFQDAIQPPPTNGSIT